MVFVRRVVLRAVAIVAALTIPVDAAVINVPRDQPTVQAGIRAAATGDTVLVAPGTYFENLDFLGKAITVTSLGGESVTILDGGSKAPVVTFKSGETRSSVLSHFTIRNGGPTEVTNTTFGMGGVNVSNSQPSILNNIITQNNCWGIVTGGAAPLIQGNEISKTLSPDYGCGFGSGAAIYVGGDLQPYTAGSAGVRTPAQIVGNVIEDNTRSGLSDAGGNGGAGVAVWGGSPVIANNIIRNNASPGGSGGAINVEYGAGAAIVQNLIYGNSAACGGGAIAFEEGGVGPDVSILIANNTIANNGSTADAGFSECTRASQIYPSPAGYGDSGPTAIIVNNILSGSDPGPAVLCGQYSRRDEAHQPLFDHNLLYNAGGAFFSSLCVDVSAKYGNVSGDPQFADAAHGNFHVQRGSPAIDAGNNSALQVLQSLNGVVLSRDLDQRTRVADSTGKGYPVIDMGAYETAGVADGTPTTLLLGSSTYYGAADGKNTLIATARSVLGVPTGEVTFYLDGRQIGISTLAADGTATLANVPFSPGTHALLATYPGQGSFPPATSLVVIIEIQPYATTLVVTSSPNPSLVGQPVTFTVTSTSGDPNFVPSPIALHFDGSGSSAAVLSPDASGKATYTTSTLALGGHQVEADFAGDSVHASGGSSLDFQTVVNGYATTTQISSSLNPANVSQAVTITAAVSSANGSPAGTVSFLDGATILATRPISAGMASFTTSTLSAGTHAIQAVYNASGTFASSMAGLSEVVHGVATATTLRAAPVTAYAGSAITLTAQTAANGAPITGSSGTVSFSEGATVLGGGATPVGAGGSAALTLTTLPAGTHAIVAVFSGDATHDPSSSAAVTVTVLANPTALALSSSNDAAVAFQTFQLSAHLSSTTTAAHASGEIVFAANGMVLGRAPLSTGGVASLPVSLAAGTYGFSAAFAGDAVFGASSSAALSEQVARDASVNALAVSPNPALQTRAVTLMASVTAASSGALPTGTVNFLDGSTTLASVPVDATGHATMTRSTFAPGGHPLVAVYSGSSNHLPSTSPVVTLEIAPQDFSLSADSGISLRAEYHGDLNVSLASTGGFADTVELSCSGLPVFASCTFANAAPVLAEAGSLSTVIHVDTDALLNYKAEMQRPGRFAGMTLALLVPVGMLMGWRRPGTRLLTAMLAVWLTAGGTLLAGCSGRIPSHAAPGTYDITLTARGRNTGITHSAHFQLVIKE